LNVVMCDIHAVNLAQLDLNLLRVLDALFEEGSVGRAATRLRLSQPAVSNALSRLRIALEDPLFVRSREGMLPTAKARGLRGPVTGALRQLAQALDAPDGFDPLTARRSFVLAASDHAQLLVIPRLAKVLQGCAGLSLKVLAPPRDFPLRELESGELDLVLGAFDLAPGDRVPRGLKRQLLVEERFVLVGRKGHPALKEPLPRLIARPQLHVSPRGGTEGSFERTTRTRRNIVLFTPHYLSTPWTLAETDLIAALPERVGRLFAEQFPLTVRPIDIPGARIKLQQVWHPVRQEEPAHRWLREQVRRAAGS
jgi:DNA-binding transcriptional LysR family regulator